MKKNNTNAFALKEMLMTSNMLINHLDDVYPSMKFGMSGFFQSLTVHIYRGAEFKMRHARCSYLYSKPGKRGDPFT